MKTVQQDIVEKLNANLAPEQLDVINESASHNVPKNSETHFKVIATSDVFEGLRPVQRHQKVYGILAHELANGVHALALHLYTPLEWQEHKGIADSPPCLGGSI